VTIWVIVLRTAFSVVTSVPLPSPRFFIAAATPSTTTRTVAPRMNQNGFLDLDFLGAGVVARGVASERMEYQLVVRNVGEERLAWLWQSCAAVIPENTEGPHQGPPC